MLRSFADWLTYNRVSQSTAALFCFSIALAGLVIATMLGISG